MTSLSLDGNELHTMQITKEDTVTDLIMTERQLKNAIELNFFENIPSPSNGKHHRRHSMIANILRKKWSAGTITLVLSAAINQTSDNFCKLINEIKAIRYLVEGVGGTVSEQSIGCSSNNNQMLLFQVNLPFLQMEESESIFHNEIKSSRSTFSNNEDFLSNTEPCKKQPSMVTLFSIFKKSSAKIHIEQNID